MKVSKVELISSRLIKEKERGLKLSKVYITPQVFNTNLNRLQSLIISF